MDNWMKEFLSEFPNATERHTGMRQRLDLVESLVSEARRSREVTVETLRILENNEHWTYPAWWPSLSKILKSPITLPPDFQEEVNRQRAIQSLLNRLQHIEVVSVVLRFLFPEEFAIISPPVCALLNLPPLDDHVPYYMSYLRTLSLLADYYGLGRVADVDMALWSAAHSQADLPAIAQLMYQDEYFQEIRLKNMFSGIGTLGARSAGKPVEDRMLKEHLLVARAFLPHDHILAALICGRTFEALVDIMSSRWGVPHGVKRWNQSEFRNRLKKIGQLDEFKELGYSANDLDRWWNRRNEAAHPDKQISRKNAEEFVSQVSELAKKLLLE